MSGLLQNLLCKNCSKLARYKLSWHFTTDPCRNNTKEMIYDSNLFGRDKEVTIPYSEGNHDFCNWSSFLRSGFRSMCSLIALNKHWHRATLQRTEQLHKEVYIT